jgi:hypothetical protein
MAANRTYKFYGQGYGTSPVSIVAKVNATTIFSGEIPTSNAALPDPLTEQLIFELVDSSALGTDFAGSLTMTITVTGEDKEPVAASFQSINCNYMQYTNPVFSAEDLAALQNPATPHDTVVDIRATYAVPPFTTEEITFLKEHSLTDPVEQQQAMALLYSHGVANYTSSADVFLPCYIGKPTNSEATLDARSSVVIEGVAQPNPHVGEFAGTGNWTWVLATDSTFAHNWNISAGMYEGVTGVGSTIQSTY